MRNSPLVWTIIVIIIVALGAYAIFYPHPGISPFATSTPAGATSTAASGGVPSSTVTFYCQQGQITAIFAKSSVALTLSDGRKMTLPQAVSGSGIRYEATVMNKDVVFSSKGSSASLSENDTATYANCVAAHIVNAGQGFHTYFDQTSTFSFVYPDAFAVVGAESGYTNSWRVNATSSG